MYNSSIKGQSKTIKFDNHINIPHKIFFNDLSKKYMCDEFRECDVVFSEIAWQYGYKMFNDSAKNNSNSYADYLININKLIEELGVPAFIVCGKPARKYFSNAKMFPFTINTSGTNISGCQLYVWNFDFSGKENTSEKLIDFLSVNFDKCLDFSCGYGEHLLKFKDFVACDINEDCLTYLSILEERRRKDV